MERETLSQKAYELVKAKIQDGEYTGYLNAHKIARDLDMGYTPVREAMLLLQNEGIVQREDNVGFFVTQVGYDSLVSIFQVRECIELYVWEQAFSMITDKEINLMKEIHKKEKEFFYGNNTKEYVKMDIDLHMVILNLYNNDDLTKLYYNVRQRYLICPIQTARKVNEAALNEHEEWVRCVENHDYEATMNCVRKHITNTKLRMKEGFISLYK